MAQRASKFHENSSSQSPFIICIRTDSTYVIRATMRMRRVVCNGVISSHLTTHPSVFTVTLASSNASADTPVSVWDEFWINVKKMNRSWRMYLNYQQLISQHFFIAIVLISAGRWHNMVIWVVPSVVSYSDYFHGIV